MRKLWIGVAILFFSPILAPLALHALVEIREWLFPLNVWVSADCTRQPLGTVQSPNKGMEVQAFGILCTAPLAGAFGNMADYKTIVLVKPGEEPSLDKTVMNITINWQEAEKIRWENDMVWQSASQLIVTLPESASLWDQKRSLSGITVNIKRVRNRLATHPTP